MVKSAMESVHRLEVPLVVDVSLGDNWRDAK
jgi:DNA polymerase I-like protein with 3'-5' exonuclease and polymerase domains